MNPGTLDTRARFEKKTKVKDPVHGSQSEQWVPFAVRWVGLQDVLPSRAEKMLGQMVISANSTRLRMRYCSDIHSGMRIVVDRPAAVTYSIISGPAIVGNKQFLEFMIERVSSND